MCELFAMSARYPTNVSLSLHELSRHGGELGPHADGWGIAYYEDFDVRMLREPCAASESRLMSFVREEGVQSDLVIAHIRQATLGTVHLYNTHPFRRELGGRIHTFAHNGHLEGIQTHPVFETGRYMPVGTTDSEYAFCVLMGRLERLWSVGTPTPTERFATIETFASELRPLGPANFMYADGEYLFVHGHKRTQKDGERKPPGLHVLCRSCREQENLSELVGVQVEEMEDAEEAARQVVTLVASVPLSDEGWRPLEDGEVLMLRHGAVFSTSTG
ncbi:MAG TPA: class II glutamine amidotransferase [Myxococcales bacterium]|nr:class II glutamine amidotransferase [Deltaproteobacteria bacterium]HAA55690.1 class II glutamine amidotransferase [Myxococcales bacterium]|tara:strand:- start:1120 stop:1944 length:825 start_codon:yes stop_codon:yes gene_type:complete